MNKNLILTFSFLILLSACTPQPIPSQPVQEEYDPLINPSGFVPEITNKYFTLTPGKKLIYEGQTEEGTERIEFIVTPETKIVLGVTTTVVWDRVWLNGELIEDTKGWYAQDKEGNVWYFGEETKELLDGKITSTHGSWEAGINGAKPGIIMKANPTPGESYRQEYYQGEAEDMADILSLGETIEVGGKTFTNCLKTRDWTPLERDVDEHKYYCPEAGGVVLEIGLKSGERIELVDIIEPITDEQNSITLPEEEPSQELERKITEQEAEQTALAEVPGKVTDITIERKFGKITYVVEIDADKGPETDVIIDIDAGEILGTEI